MNKKDNLLKLKKAMMIAKVQQKMNNNQGLFNIIREIKTLVRKVQTGVEITKKGSINDAINLVYSKVFAAPGAQAEE